MAYTTILADVKAALGITGNYQDPTITNYIAEVKEFMLDGGINETIVNSEKAKGIIARGVADLWNYGSGGTNLSPYFYQRVTQLAMNCRVDNKAFSTLKFIKNYLFEIDYDYLDYDFANAYMKEKQPTIDGACSSIRNGNWYGRNLDWMYDENAEFIVRTPQVNGKYATIGFASAISGLTNEFVKSQSDSELYKIVPFMLADGINECGVVANTNVVPTDKGITTGTIPLISKEVEICSVMLVRYILDHFASAKEAVDYIKNYISVYVPTTLLKMRYETHLMIADETETYLVEFYGNETVVTLMNKPYMTNFYLSDVTLNDDDKVYTPESEGHLASENNISDYGSGLERYNLIVDNYANANTKDGMRELMTKLKFTNAYKSSTNPFWYTEFVGNDGLTVDSEVDDFSEVVNRAMRLFDNRIRNGKTWFTNHSAVYDIENRKVSVIAQEDGEVLNYEL